MPLTRSSSEIQALNASAFKARVALSETLVIVIVVIVVVVARGSAVDLQDAVEVEGAAVEHFVERHAGALGAVDLARTD